MTVKKSNLAREPQAPDPDLLELKSLLGDSRTNGPTAYTIKSSILFKFCIQVAKNKKKTFVRGFFEQCHIFHFMALQPFFECQAITQSKLHPHRVVIYRKNQKKRQISEMEPIFKFWGVSTNQGPKTPPKTPKTPKYPGSNKNGGHHEKEHTFFNKKPESFLLALAFLGGPPGPKIFFRADSSKILHTSSKK